MKMVSDEQLARMLDFMEEHQDLARGHVGNHGPLAKQNTQKLWEELALILNSMGRGQSRSAGKWREYWQTKKSKLKKKIADKRQHRMGTGGGPPCKIIITPVDERIISLISKASIYGAEDVPVSSIFPLLEDHPAVPSPSCSSVVGSLEPSATTSAPATQDNYEVEEAVTTPVHTNKEAVQDPHHPTEDVQRPDERESRANRTPRPSVGRGWLGGTLTARLVDVEERRLLQTDRRIDVEERRLAVETQRLAVETQRLAVEERRLAVEEQRLALEQERQLAP